MRWAYLTRRLFGDTDMARCDPSVCLWVNIAQKSSDQFEAKAFRRSWQLMVLLHCKTPHDHYDAVEQMKLQFAGPTDEEEAFLARFNKTIAAYGRRK